MMKIFRSGMPLVFVFLAFFPAYAQEEIIIPMTNFPPYSYFENGTPTGYTTEFMEAVVKAAGMTAIFKEYPWVRAVKTAMERSNVLVAVYKNPFQ
ncbi:MAG: hypothetical protein PVJ84_19035 [Desulfobacteraceae bacterium]